MTSVTQSLSEIPKEYTGVLKIAGCYSALHLKNDRKIFISSRLEEDLKIATFAALKFSYEKNIPCSSKILELNTPLIGTIEENGKWYPAEFYSNSIWFERSSAGFKDEAKEKAEKFANENKRDFVPTLEIRLEVGYGL